MSNIPFSILGRTSLSVTRLGYGAGHRKPMNNAQRKEILNSVLDLGINFIDTSDCYGNSEELIGRYIGHRRSEYYIATKCGSFPSGHLWTKENLFRNLEESLKRMSTDHIDVMQLHGASVSDCEQETLVESLQIMQTQGKVQWIGASTNLPDLETFLEWNIFDVLQLPYSALDRDHEHWISKAAEAGAGIIIRGGAALGEPEIGSWNRTNWDKFEEANLDDLRAEGESRTAFVVRLSLSNPNVHTNIVGTTNSKHLIENVTAVSRGQLPDDITREAKRRLSAVGVGPKK
jgi:aryl-alcohol dehydrogenase-like predicted oxidoreductase